MQKYIKHAFKISTIIITSPLLLLGIIAYTVVGYVVTGFNMGEGIWEKLTNWTNND
jgi:hypothetical protein